MRQRHDLAPHACLLLTSALALTLGACNSDAQNDTESAETTGTTGTTGDSATDPTTTPTTDPQTTDPQTTDPQTTDPVDTDTDTDTGDTGGTAELTALWATANPGGLTTDALVGVTPTLGDKLASLTVLGDVVSIQSVGLRSDGDGVITYDAPVGGGLIIVEGLGGNNPMNGAIGLGEIEATGLSVAEIRGAATGLLAPMGVEAAGPDGLVLVADTGAAAILGFDFADEGDIAPQFTITDLGSSAAVWDIHYVASADTLYAAGTNGEVQVYENFSDDMGQMGPDRTIVPTVNGNKVSVNLHGITVDADTLYLSDVVINGAADADGKEAVAQRIQGGDLGNPVDLEYRGGLVGRLYVAEKANDALLVYEENLLANELQPGASLELIKPESVALGAGTRLTVASNPAGLDTDAALAINAGLGDPTVTATRNQLGSVTSIQSLVLAGSGDAYVGFDGPAVSGGAGVFRVPGLTAVAADGETSAVAERLWGPKTGLVAPKGMVLSASQDRLIVADFGAADIKVFDAAALGDTAPLFVVEDLGGGAVWDVHHDATSDLLFAAGVDGTVRVFEGFLAGQGADAPARSITPVDEMGNKISVNLHGIHYDPASDTLILSDVGDAMSSSDGQIFVIPDAATADDDVEVSLQIGGDQTQLGNPVDLSFDGANLFVAEKANSALIRFDALLGRTGFNNQPGDATIEVVNAESLQLAYTTP